MDTIIAVGVLLLIVGLAALYVIRAKKSGRKCIGCPDGCCTPSKDGSAGSPCSGTCSGCCGCGKTTPEEK